MASEPCGQCLRDLAAAGRLRHMRLGKIERALLLKAVENAVGQHVVPIPLERTARGKTAQRRAVAKLVEFDLLDIAPDPDNPSRPLEKRLYRDEGGKRRLAGRVRFMIPRPLARHIVDVCGGPLGQRQPIRWSKSLPKVKRAGLDDCGCLPPDDRDRYA